MIAYAASEGVTAAKRILGRIEDVIFFPVITLIMSVALLMFLYGIYEYVLHGDDDTARSTGKTHMLWGIIGLLVMISAWGILKIAAGTVGITNF
jgi:hypothetical protein